MIGSSSDWASARDSGLLESSDCSAETALNVASWARATLAGTVVQHSLVTKQGFGGSSWPDSPAGGCCAALTVSSHSQAAFG